MAEKKFIKGSEEWLMFQDYWRLCQKFWNVEDTEEYWDNLIAYTSRFMKKYDGIKLSKNIALAFIDCQECERKTNDTLHGGNS